MLGQKQNPEESCGAKYRNSLLGFYVLYSYILASKNAIVAKQLPIHKLSK